MDFKTFGELLSSLPFVRWLAPHASFIARGLSSLLLVIAGANICYYLFGFGRDDIYTTERVEGTPFIVTKPRLIHESFKDYDFFLAAASTTRAPISGSAGAATPASTGTTVGGGSLVAQASIPRSIITDTVVVTVSATSGALLLPQQTLAFTFTPSIYESQRITFRNDLSGTTRAEVSLTATSGIPHTFSIPYESSFDAFVRRAMIVDSWNVFVLIVPFVLFFFSQLFLMQKDLLDEKNKKLRGLLEEKNKELIEDIRKELRGGDLTKARQLSENLRRDLLDAQQKHTISIILSTDIDWHFQYLFSKKDIRSFDHSSNGEVEDRLKRLLDAIPQTDEIYRETLIHQSQLLENIETSKKYGDTESLRSDRSRIIDQLNRISINVLNEPFQRLASETPKYNEEDWQFTPSLEYLNEHLAWLIYPGRHPNLGVNLLADILEYNKQQRDGERLDANIYKQVEDLYQLNRYILPPSYFADLAKLHDTSYLDALNLDKHFLPEEQHDIIAIYGKKGSGKTATLQYFGQAFHTPKTFYAFIALNKNHQSIEEIINSIQLTIIQILMDIFLKHPYVWSSLNAHHDRLKKIFQQFSSIFNDGNPIGYLKRTRKSRDNRINKSRKDMIDWLQTIRRSTLESIDSSTNVFMLADIGTVLSEIGYEQICISLDEANINFNPVECMKTLDESIDQKILLRIAYSEYEEDEHAFDDGFVKVISLDTWSPDKIDDIFVAVFGQGNRFDADGSVRGEFTKVVDVPGDLLIWANVFDVCYPDAYVSRLIWDRVCEAMRQARSELHAEHWNTLVSARAIELLQNAAAHDHE